MLEPMSQLNTLYKYPFSFNDKKHSSPKMIWSRTSIPRLFPTATNRSVTSISSGLGIGSPDGQLQYLYTEMDFSRK